MNPESFFTSSQKQIIETAISKAERMTSGEIRLHIDRVCHKDVMERSLQVFNNLGMYKTDLGTGVLFYLSIEDKKFAVIGDKGINAKVENDFWDNIFSTIVNYFKRSEFTEGLCWAIEEAGVQLSTYFPIKDDDINELPNTISFEK